MKLLLLVMLVMGFVVGKHAFGASDQAEHEPVFSTMHASVYSSLQVAYRSNSFIVDSRSWSRSVT